MKIRILLSLLVILVAGAIAYFDVGMVGSGVGMAMAFPLLSLDFEGEDNLPGVARAYCIPVADIATEAVPMENPTTALESITIVGSHTLAAIKYFKKMYSTQGKGTLNFAAEGGRDFENFSVGGTLFYPSTKAEALAMASAVLGVDMIIEIEENSDSDYFLQVGTKKLPARLVSNGDWGTELNGEKGITFTIQAFHGKKTPYIYNGVIALAADNIVS